MAEKLVVIDTDAGTDDALAIFMAIQAHKNPDVPFKIVGITCVHGNTTVDNVCRNVTRILKASDSLEIPIFRGCEEAMVIPYNLGGHVHPFHGYDGFGDTDLPEEDPKLEAENGVLALIRLAKEYPGQLSILALGPLTNLAMAVRLEPSIANNVKEIYLMGGNCEGMGNTTPNGEFNFIVDPESAHVTLSSFPCPIVVTPWELCKRQGQNFTGFRLDTLGKVISSQMQLLNIIEQRNLGKRKWFPCDSLATAVLIEPKLIERSAEYHCTLELSGTHARGMMVVDHEGLLNQRKNVTIVYDMDNELLKKLLIWAVGGDYYA